VTTDEDLQFFTEGFNREVKGVEAEIWLHTYCGNTSQQRLFWTLPAYKRALPDLLELDADVITFECASSGGKDLPLLGRTVPRRSDRGLQGHNGAMCGQPSLSPP
jgi:hypothetical protein